MGTWTLCRRIGTIQVLSVKFLLCVSVQSPRHFFGEPAKPSALIPSTRRTISRHAPLMSFRVFCRLQDFGERCGSCTWSTRSTRCGSTLPEMVSRGNWS
eukprot:49702-Rhodomonas_salina.1